MIRRASFRIAHRAARRTRSIVPSVQNAAIFPNVQDSFDQTQRRLKSSSSPPRSSLHQKAMNVLRNHTNKNQINGTPEKKAKVSVAGTSSGTDVKTATSDIKPKDDDDDFLNESVSPKSQEDDKTKLETRVDPITAVPKPEEAPKPRMAPHHFLHEFAPKIVVVGVGGAGGNALNNMIAKELTGVEFLALNTDAQHLSSTLTDQRLQLGVELTKGLGCGANPQAGAMAAEESREQIQERLEGAHLVFITAGMGGGTGTGAAPVVAELCYEMGILTVGVVTLPFTFEGTHRKRLAMEGIERLQSVVDTMIVIPNQNLFQIAGPETTFVDAFQMADGK